MRFSNRRLRFFVFVFLCCCKRNRKKRKKAQNPIKMLFFKGGYPKMRKMKKWIFSKNCLTLFVSGRRKTHFRAHYLFRPKNFLPTTVKTRSNYKNSGFSGNCPKPKMTSFMEKGVFGMGEKVFFLLIVFLKRCVSRKRYFIVFSAKHSSCNKKDVCWKRTEIYEK